MSRKKHIWTLLSLQKSSFWSKIGVNKTSLRLKLHATCFSIHSPTVSCHLIVAIFARGYPICCCCFLSISHSGQVHSTPWLLGWEAMDSWPTAESQCELSPTSMLRFCLSPPVNGSLCYAMITLSLVPVTFFVCLIERYGLWLATCMLRIKKRLCRVRV